MLSLATAAFTTSDSDRLGPRWVVAEGCNEHAYYKGLHNQVNGMLQQTLLASLLGTVQTRHCDLGLSCRHLLTRPPAVAGSRP